MWKARLEDPSRAAVARALWGREIRLRRPTAWASGIVKPEALAQASASPDVWTFCGISTPDNRFPTDSLFATIHDNEDWCQCHRSWRRGNGWVYKVRSLFKSHYSFDSFFNIKQYRISTPFRATRFAPRCVFLIFNLFPSASSKDVRADSGRRRESSSDICRQAFVLNMFIPFLFLGTTALLSMLWSLCRALALTYFLPPVPRMWEQTQVALILRQTQVDVGKARQTSVNGPSSSTCLFLFFSSAPPPSFPCFGHFVVHWPPSICFISNWEFYFKTISGLLGI